MPSRGSRATASWAKRPAAVIGWRFDWRPPGTSKMKPCFCASGMFGAPVKSGPTSGPLTVSSHVIQLPQGMGAARAVHLGAVEAGERRDDLADGGDHDRGGATLALGRRGRRVAEGAATGLLTSWLRTSTTLPWRPGRRPCRRGARGARCRRRGSPAELGVVERPVLEARRQVEPDDAVAQVGAARRVFWRSRPFALAAIAVNPWNGPPTAMAVAAPAAPCRNRRRSMLGICRSSRTPREAAESTPPERLIPGRSGRPNLRCAGVRREPRGEGGPKPHAPAPDQRQPRRPAAHGGDGAAGSARATSTSGSSPRRGTSSWPTPRATSSA